MKTSWQICLALSGLLAVTPAPAQSRIDPNAHPPSPEILRWFLTTTPLPECLTNTIAAEMETAQNRAVQGLRDLAKMAEIQRNAYDRITPPGIHLTQPLPWTPFAAGAFPDPFLQNLTQNNGPLPPGAYPLTLTLDPNSKKTLFYNHDGKLLATIATAFARPASARIKLHTHLVRYSAAPRFLAACLPPNRPDPHHPQKSAPRKPSRKFRISHIEPLPNSHIRLTLTNGPAHAAADIFAYTITHTSSISLLTWTNDENETLTTRQKYWAPTSPHLTGKNNAWECLATHVPLTNGTATWTHAHNPETARIRFYTAAITRDSDRDGLSDATEILVTHTDPTTTSTRQDSDHDSLPDAVEIFITHTDPHHPDSDRDGWSDVDEYFAQTNPLDTNNQPWGYKNDHPHVVINRVMYNPAGPDTGREWIELYSATPHPVKLDGFTIQTAGPAFSNIFTFPPNTWIEPGCCLLLGGPKITNADFIADFSLPNAFTNEPTAAIRLVHILGTNLFLADALFYGGNPKNFNPNHLDTSGWRNPKTRWAGAGNALSRYWDGADSDSHGDWLQETSPPPKNSSTPIDTDGDGLSNNDEITGTKNPFNEPTSPYHADSDNDGLSDAEECITYKTNPKSSASDGDIFPWPPPSGTALSNWWGSDSYEIAHGWNPLVYDENNNQIPDSWEMAFPGPSLYDDADGDGIPNNNEPHQNNNPFHPPPRPPPPGFTPPGPVTPPPRRSGFPHPPFPQF